MEFNKYEFLFLQIDKIETEFEFYKKHYCTHDFYFKSIGLIYTLGKMYNGYSDDVSDPDVQNALIEKIEDLYLKIRDSLCWRF
jgi:hypothetical protein